MLSREIAQTAKARNYVDAMQQTDGKAYHWITLAAHYVKQ